MKIGLTYDLRSEYLAQGFSEEDTAEFDRDDTIIAIEDALQSLGMTTDRIGNVHQLIEKISRGNRWDLVFNICEGLYGIAREAQVPAILDAYKIPYTFSDPLVMSLSLNKGFTKQIVKASGCLTPAHAVVPRVKDIEHIFFEPPYFIKPLAEGTGKGITEQSIVRSRNLLQDLIENLLTRFNQPVLVEQYLPGREFTVGIVGTGDEAMVLGTLEIILLDDAEKEVYSYINKEQCESLVEYRLGDPKDQTVTEAEKLSLNAWRTLGCRDGGRVDIRCDDKGNPNFLEVNPLAGLHPEHSDLPILCNKLNIPYIELIKRILDSAMTRIPA